MIDRLAEIMAVLRDPAGGCDWDKAQTFETIAPYTIEEAYEVADAIERNDMADLKDELGDLLLQVVYHARIAEESGAFDLAGVIDAACDKMIRRHPHIFSEGVRSSWEDLKAAERGSSGPLDGVARGLPALLRAYKIQRRAARAGFDWADADGPRSKVIEELAEVDAARTHEERIDELGDLLFAATNWARHLNVEPEAALRQATAKFERRFRAMEVSAGDAFAGMTLIEKERLWEQVKQAEHSPGDL